MTKKLAAYVKSKAGLALIGAALFCGTAVGARMHSLPCTRCDIAESAVRKVESQVGQVSAWIETKYDGVRFVYRIALQVRKMHAQENAVEPYRGGHFAGNANGVLARIDCSRFGSPVTQGWKN